MLQNAVPLTIQQDSAYIDEIENAERLFILGELHKYHITRRQYLGTAKCVNKGIRTNPSYYNASKKFHHEAANQNSSSLLKPKDLFHKRAEQLRHKLILLLNDPTKSEEEILKAPISKRDNQEKRLAVYTDNEIETDGMKDKLEEKRQTINDVERENRSEDSVEDPESLNENLNEMKELVVAKTDNSNRIPRIANTSEVPLLAGNKINVSKIIPLMKTPERKGKEDCSEKVDSNFYFSHEKCSYSHK